MKTTIAIIALLALTGIADAQCGPGGCAPSTGFGSSSRYRGPILPRIFRGRSTTYMANTQGAAYVGGLADGYSMAAPAAQGYGGYAGYSGVSYVAAPQSYGFDAIYGASACPGGVCPGGVCPAPSVSYDYPVASTQYVMIPQQTPTYSFAQPVVAPSSNGCSGGFTGYIQQPTQQASSGTGYYNGMPKAFLSESDARFRGIESQLKDLKDAVDGINKKLDRPPFIKPQIDEKKSGAPSTNTSPRYAVIQWNDLVSRGQPNVTVYRNAKKD